MSGGVMRLGGYAAGGSCACSSSGSGSGAAGAGRRAHGARMRGPRRRMGRKALMATSSRRRKICLTASNETMVASATSVTAESVLTDLDDETITLRAAADAVVSKQEEAARLLGNGRQAEMAAVDATVAVMQQGHSVRHASAKKLNPRFLEKAYERCGIITEEYAKTFYLGTQLMTEEKRRAIWAIYGARIILVIECFRSLPFYWLLPDSTARAFRASGPRVLFVEMCRGSSSDVYLVLVRMRHF